MVQSFLSRVHQRLLGAVFALALVSGGVLVAPLSAEAAQVSVPDAVAQILAETNARRAAGGLPPLIESNQMDTVAQNWSTQMYANGAMTHNPNYSSQIPGGWTSAAENIASGYTSTTVVEAWHQSPGHYANIMGNYNAIGIGYYEANGQTYFTQDFGRYATVPSPTAPPASSAAANAQGAVPVYRFWSPKSSSHFYTASLAERDSIIASYPTSTWTYEGIAFSAFTTQQAGTVPLYRFWSPLLSGHFYTASVDEKNSIIANYPSSTWSLEGIAFYVYPSTTTVPGTIAVSRFWSPTYQQHFYTASADEKRSITATYPTAIWTYEGDTYRVPATPSVSSTSVSGPALASSVSGLSLPTGAWWGGPSYYARFSKAAASGWTSPSFFPIAVFLGKPSDASALKAAGINTYMGAEHDGSPISTITSTGMDVIAQNEWTPAEIGNDPRVVGWHVSDECEMGSSGCTGTTETARLTQQQQLATTFRNLGDGRFLQSNFGNGVLGTYWAPTTMPQFVHSVDVTSVDKYAYTSPAVDGVITQSWNWPQGKNPATSSAYGWLQDRMATFSGAATPNWVFVETAKPFLTEAGARTITPDQIEGAVWNAIIHGAAGIAYFQHNNNGTCGTYSILQCGATLTAKITTIDQQVQSLAPVINTPSYQWNFGPGLDTSLKTSTGSAYIFAMTDGTTGTKTFTLPPGVTGTIQVIGENRTITPTNGTYTDTFPNEYTHHIYRIALG